MKFTGKTNINAPLETVWAFLIDANQVAACAPGVESMEVVEENKKFKVVASVGFGNIKAKFDNDIEFLEIHELSMAKIKAHGTAPGSAADVIATMRISKVDDNITDLDWEAEINVMGTIASLASRMMGSVVGKISAQFFDCVKAKIEG